MGLRRVVNASPIIYLHRVGLLDQLNEPGVRVFVPDAVFEELGGLGPDDPARIAVLNANWIEIVATPAIPESLPPFRLDRGESAMIAVALLPSEQETDRSDSTSLFLTTSGQAKPIQTARLDFIGKDNQRGPSLGLRG